MNNKKAIFDTVRAMLGRGFTQSEVDLLDRVIDEREGGVPSPRLGALSERFESGGRGPGAVSSGKGDPGGVSYGIWQLSSRACTAAAFVAAEGARWRADFAGAAPGTSAFTAAWQAIATQEPSAFAEAQHMFIERTHYATRRFAMRPGRSRSSTAGPPVSWRRRSSGRTLRQAAPRPATTVR
ncbi:MAG: hypothetical protein JF595_11905 [Sphingomonadales bacterium]|nr:hypothetical protein [Sphingomonadales bacterium]